MSIKQRIWLLPAIAMLASMLSLSANYWLTSSASRVLTDADTLQYPAVNALNSMIAAVDGVEETLKYAVSVDDKNAVAAVDGKVAMFTAAASELAALPGESSVSRQLSQEFDQYRRSSTDAVLLMLGVRRGDTNAAIEGMQKAQAALKTRLAGAKAESVAAFERNLTGAQHGLTRQLIASFICALAIVLGLALVSYFLIPAIERDAVLVGVSEYTDSAVMTTDAAGRITWVNAGFKRMTELDPDGVLGRAPEDLLERTSADPRACAAIREARATGKGWRQDVRSITPGRREYFAHIESQPVLEKDGSIKGHIVIETDVTQRYRDAQALRAARDSADEASRTKSAFLANMSHEIRTPLNGVIGMSGLLLDTPLSTEQREFAEIARSSGESLLTLINDILDFSKIEAGHLEFESLDFDFVALIESAVDAVLLRAVEKNVEVLIDIDPGITRYLRGDPTRVRQIVLNLLGNAVKFTEHGDVRVTARERAGNPHPAVIIEVMDSGIGMSAEQLGRLFTPFTQADGSTTRRFGGTGLGLSITKRLVDAMGGRISVDSEEGRGSTFGVQLSFDRAQQASPAAAPAMSALHVLVVEDHAINRRILDAHLRSVGARVTLTAGAAQALQVFESLKAGKDLPQLILLDHDLPEHDGLWVAEQLRLAAGTSMPPILLLTSLGGLVRAKANASGCARVLTKPLKRDALIEAIIQTLQAAAPQASASLPADQGKSPPPGTRRVLVAEDNIVNQKLIIRLLEKIGASVTVAGTGTEALRRLQDSAADLVLMDCQMPEMDGYEATRRIRQGEAGEGARHLPIIALTANALTGDRDRCLQAGMNDYLTKPIDPKTLRAVVERHVPRDAAPALRAAAKH